MLPHGLLAFQFGLSPATFHNAIIGSVYRLNKNEH